MYAKGSFVSSDKIKSHYEGDSYGTALEDERTPLGNKRNRKKQFESLNYFNL